MASLERVIELGRRGAKHVAELGLAYGASGRTREAEGLLAELVARSSDEYVSPLCFTDILLGLGRNDEAAAWLEKAYDTRLPGLPTYFLMPICFGAAPVEIVDDFARRMSLPRTLGLRRSGP